MMIPQLHLPFVSIIIPTFNDHDVLEICLDRLKQQTYPLDRYEIIVVNNNPLNPLPPAQPGLPHIQLVEEPKPGSYAARNQGVSIAQGEILAFTDADCIPARDWLESGVTAILEHPSCQLLAGRIDILLSEKEHHTPFELYELVQAFNQRLYVQRDRYSVTANLFVFRSIFDAVGGFSEDLHSGGDFEWGRRATSQGYAWLYGDSVKIYHPARKNLREMIKKTRRIVQGHHDLVRKRLYPRSRFIVAIFIDLLFPYRSVPTIVSNDRLQGLSNKLMAAWASIIVRYLRAFYRVKVVLEYQFNRV